MTRKQILIKRLFDLLFSFMGLFFLWPVIILAIIVASIDTRSFGVFIQKRIGLNGKIINVFKVKTMYPSISGKRSSITADVSSSISKSGMVFRAFKVDELPQLLNVFIGTMSFVGPRPDVPGYADKLVGDDRVILKIKPGITGPASIKYANEEEILSGVDNPKHYNDHVIWPDKVKINKCYYFNYTLFGDIKYILNTIGF